MDAYRKKLLEQGAHGIKGIGRTFRIQDGDGNRNINFEEFSEGCSDYGLDIPMQQIGELFGTFDKDGSGTISFDEFLLALRGNLTGSRLAIVKVAFKKADMTGDGVLSAKDLKRMYKVRDHPKYKNGEWDENQVFMEFLKSFEPDQSKREGNVTEEEFIDYYAGLSANIDNTGYFDMMMRNAWKI